jgi:hypothetical protein
VRGQELQRSSRRIGRDRGTGGRVALLEGRGVRVDPSRGGLLGWHQVRVRGVGLGVVQRAVDRGAEWVLEFRVRAAMRTRIVMTRKLVVEGVDSPIPFSSFFYVFLLAFYSFSL